MKTFLIILIGFVCTINKGYTQGIEFLHDLDKALVQAKSENKIIFVDFYASWCRPCKVLANDFFTLEKIGSFYNSNFINCKIQCNDNDKGAKLKEKYKVVAFPTLLFLDKNGEIIHLSRGVFTENGLIELGKTALNPETNLQALDKNWHSGVRDKEFVSTYFKALKNARRFEKANTNFLHYFNELNSNGKTSMCTFELIKLTDPPPFSPVFSFIEDHKEEYYNTVGKKEIEDYIATEYLWYLKKLLNKGHRELYESSLKKFEEKGYPYYDEYAMFYSVFEAKDSTGKLDLKEYIKRGTEFLDKYGKNNDYYTIVLTGLLGNHTSKPNEGEAGIKWMENLLEWSPEPKYLYRYLYILRRNFRYEQAIEVGKQIRANAIKNNKSTKRIDKQIQEIIGYKEKRKKGSFEKK